MNTIENVYIIINHMCVESRAESHISAWIWTFCLLCFFSKALNIPKRVKKEMSQGKDSDPSFVETLSYLTEIQKGQDVCQERGDGGVLGG